MKIIKRVTMMLLMFNVIGSANAQSSNLKTEHIRILGNCEMCKSTIEKSGSKKGIARVQWDNKSQMAIVIYDSAKQTGDEILKRIALAGYDNEKFLAPDEAYLKLPECCRYDRSLKKGKMADTNAKKEPHNEPEKEEEVSSLQALFSSYFDLKDAFVKSDAEGISSYAANLMAKINAVDMSKLEDDQHGVWMNINRHVMEVSTEISKSEKMDNQRIKFNELSQDFYQLAKVAHLNYEMYLQHCPMFNNGADWLSKESQIKNPFYGSQMLTCGKTTEIIK